jgi:hypothetical protein
MKSGTLQTICLIMSAVFGCTKNTSPVGEPSAQYTKIGGYVSTMLSPANSPYLVQSSLIVDSNSTLIIDAGTQIYFEDTTGIIVYGALLCQGTVSQPVLLTPLNVSWKGIQITRSFFTSTFSFVVLEKVDVTTPADSERNGALDVTNARVIVRNTIFRNNKSMNGDALSLVNSTSSVTNNIFLSNHSVVFAGALFSASSTNTIINNTFYENSTDNFGTALVLMSPVMDDVENNVFDSNTNRVGDSGIALLQTDSTHYTIDYNFLQFNGSNPQFVSETDLHLSTISPCINAGNPLGQYDDLNGTRNDQGAYGGPLGNW